MRRLFIFSLLGLTLAWAAGLLAAPVRTAAAQQPSPRPPLSATDQYLTAIAPPPTSAGGGGAGSGGGAAATAPAALAATATPGAPRPTRTPTASATPGPTQTPVLIVQTVVQTVSVVQTVQVEVVQTVVVVATAEGGPATPTPTRTLEPVGAGPAGGSPPSFWLWLVISLPILAILLAVVWLLRRDFLLPGVYPEASRPRRAGRLLGRGEPPDRPRLPE